MSWWMWLIVLFLVAGFIQKVKEEMAKATAANPGNQIGGTASQANRLFFWPVEDGSTYVTGTTHYQQALKSIAGDHGNTRAEVYCVAQIVPDPDNPHDDQAVRIDIEGNTVGHLPRDDARSYRKRMTRKQLGTSPTQCVAKVWGGFDRNNAPSEYGVDIYIKPFAA